MSAARTEPTPGQTRPGRPPRQPDGRDALRALAIDAAHALTGCGTHAAYNRHRNHGEPIDAACREAERIYQEAAWQRRKARAS